MKRLILLCLILFPFIAYAQAPSPVQNITATGPNLILNTGNGSPVFNITLTGNVTSSTIDRGETGTNIRFVICENSVGGFSFSWPAQMVNPPSITTTANACTTAEFLNMNNVGSGIWQNASSGSGSSPGGSQNPLGTAGPNPQAASYVVYTNSGTVYARNNNTGAIDYSGTDAGPVINSILTNNTTVCGAVYFRTGIYNFNSMTLETTGGYSNLYYAVGIPANQGSTNNYCEWIFEGEAETTTGAGRAVVNNGVIFNVTAAARTSCGTGHWCVAWWHRPDTTNHAGNDIRFVNMTTQFPDNQRGNEAAWLMWEASTVDYYNVDASLAVNFGGATGSNILPAVAGVNHMIGLSSTMPSRNNYQRFENTSVQGYDIGYDIESEHSVSIAATSWLNNTAINYCRTATYGSFNSGPCFHPSVWLKFTDQETINGLVIGSNIVQGSRLDILDYDIEYLNSGNFARVNNMTEANNGYTSGFITYNYVLAGTGVVGELPSGILFNSGGVNFQTYEGTQNPNNAKSAAFDQFTRPNTANPANGTNLLGPQWINNSSGSGCGITSNAAVAGTQNPASCLTSYAAQVFNNDQFVKITVNTINANANIVALVRASTTVNTQTFYAYYCKVSIGTNQRTVAKVIAGTYTQLSGNAATGCNVGDQLELWAVGSTLIAYYTPSGGARTVDFIVSDSSIASGEPGFQLNDNAASSSPSIINWSGGNLTANGFSSSIFQQAAVHTQYLSIGTAPTPTGTGACATITTQTPASIGSQAGSLKCTGTTGASTITLTFPTAQTAPNGYRCSADDSTTVANKPVETSWTTTTCVLTVSSVTANDIIVWNASPF